MGIATSTRKFLHWFLMGVDDHHHNLVHYTTADDFTAEDWSNLANAEPVHVIVQRLGITCGTIVFSDGKESLDAIELKVEGYAAGTTEPMSMVVAVAERMAVELVNSIPMVIVGHHANCLGEYEGFGEGGHEPGCPYA